MSQRVCYWCTVRANEAKIQAERMCEYKVPPPSANPRDLVPPAFADPVSSPKDELGVFVLVFIYMNWSTGIEYVRNRIIVEEDEWSCLP